MVLLDRSGPGAVLRYYFAPYAGASHALVGREGVARQETMRRRRLAGFGVIRGLRHADPSQLMPGTGESALDCS